MEFSADHSSTVRLHGGGGGGGAWILDRAEVSCGEFETLNCSGQKIPKIHTLFRAKEKMHAVLI